MSEREKEGVRVTKETEIPKERAQELMIVAVQICRTHRSDFKQKLIISL